MSVQELQMHSTLLLHSRVDRQIEIWRQCGGSVAEVWLQYGWPREALLAFRDCESFAVGLTETPDLVLSLW